VGIIFIAAIAFAISVAWLSLYAMGLSGGDASRGLQGTISVKAIVNR